MGEIRRLERRAEENQPAFLIGNTRLPIALRAEVNFPPGRRTGPVSRGPTSSSSPRNPRLTSPKRIGRRSRIRVAARAATASRRAFASEAGHEARRIQLEAEHRATSTIASRRSVGPRGARARHRASTRSCPSWGHSWRTRWANKTVYQGSSRIASANGTTSTPSTARPSLTWKPAMARLWPSASGY